jgi:hypothetical protein
MEKEEEEFIEETEIDIVATIPAHLKEFQDIKVDSVSATDLYVTIDGNRLKGRIGDTPSTNLFFNLQDEGRDVSLVSACDKCANLEHVFYVPKDLFDRPFIPSDVLKRPK